LSAAGELLPGDLAAKEADLTGAVSAGRERLRRADDESAIGNARAALARSESEFDTFVAELRRGSAPARAYAALKYPEPPGIPDIPVHADEVVLEFKVTDSTTYVWALRKDQPARVLARGVGRADLRRRLSALLGPFWESS